MRVICPSCKYGGTFRDESIPDEGKELYCPNCNVKFHVKKTISTGESNLPAAPGKAHPKDTQSQTLPISCPTCGAQGKIRHNAIPPGQTKTITCPACKNSFSLTMSGNQLIAQQNAATQPPSIGKSTPCPSCGHKMPLGMPICPSCGMTARGIKIYCPSCKSTNVGINDGIDGDGKPQWETVVFRPAALSDEKLTDIRIPLVCRDCGNKWTIAPSRIQGHNKAHRPDDPD
jgi:uncharacterized protein YbaR (Trm112 family)